MLPERQVKGCVLLHKPESLLDRYGRGDVAEQNAEHLVRIRDAMPFVEPSGYRGIAREPLRPWSSIDEDLSQARTATLIDHRKEERARRRFLEMNGEDREKWDSYAESRDYNKALLAKIEAAEELYATLNSPDDYEIVELGRESSGTDNEFLGFDVGYWRGGDFSLICDTVVMPRWHPPCVEALSGLARWMKALNKHVLFSTIEEAEAFREYYRSCEWAETEDSIGEFCVIQVALVRA